MDVESLLATARSSIVTQWAQGEDLVPPPWLCYISTTNICNSRCHVCAREKSMRAQRGSISRPLFERIVEQLPPSVSKVYLQKQGEPFIHRDLEFHVQHIKEKRPDIHIAFHTNGIIATPERVGKILPHLGSMGVSISAITPETYHRVHGVDKFRLVTANLRAISESLLAMDPASRPHVFIDFIVQQRNQDEVPLAREFFATNFPGLASVDFHWVYNFQGDIEEGALRVYDTLPHDRFPCCVFPWSTITFLHDGKVDYCFVEPREDRFLGDITTQDFDAIWNGEEFRTFRRAMADKRFADLAADSMRCNKCSWLWSMRSQSPRNLGGGYTSDLKNQKQVFNFGQIMEQSSEGMLEQGQKFYLRGEIHMALGVLHTLLTLQIGIPLRVAAEELVGLCQSVMGKYRDYPEWQRLIAEEHPDPAKRTCQYHFLKS